MRNAKRSVFMIINAKIINAEREAFRVHAKDYECGTRSVPCSCETRKIMNAEREAFRVHDKDYKCGTRSVPCS